MSPRRLVLAVGCALLALPATASAATTYTVDPAAAAGCNGTTCKSIKDALGQVADGDTVSILKGSYTESGIVAVTKKNVTLTATPGTVAITNTGAAAGDPVVRLTGEGSRLVGLVLNVPENAGPAVQIDGKDSTLETVSVINVAKTTGDTPSIEDRAPGGMTTLKGVIVLHTPDRTAEEGPTAPAILGSKDNNSMAISEAIVLAGSKSDDALRLRSQSSQPNTIVRSQLFAQAVTADALEVFAPYDNFADKAVDVDTTVLSGGQNGAGLHAITEPNSSFLGTSDAGDLDIDLTHVTVAGSDRASILEALADGDPDGSIDVSVDRSIWHGKNLLSNHDGGAIPSTSANTAKLAITNSDTEQQPQPAESGTEISVSGARTTGDAALFVDIAKKNFHLRADSPAIDKGGAAVAGESDKDIDGEARQNGSATDLGADEFVNRAPVAKLTHNLAAAKQNQAITFDAAGSTDPEIGHGGSIAKYRWEFGDGQVQETTAPSVQHAFGNAGPHDVKLTVIDNFGAASGPAVSRVTITDGVPPSVAIVTPKTDFVLRRFRFVNERIKGTKRTRRVKKARTHRFAGTAKDDASGVLGVEVSFKVTKLARTRKARTSQSRTCRFLDLKRLSVVGRPCGKPLFFRVAFKNGVWAYRTKAKTKYRLGEYEVTVRATDKAGNQATTTRAFTVK